MKKYLYLSLCTTFLSYGGEVKSLPSFQGFQGVVNTPNSEVLQEGEIQFLYTDQVDALSKSSPDFRDDKEQKNYFINMGVLPNMDFSFRYTYARDSLSKAKYYLSGRTINFKYQLPFIPKDIATVALGIQDIGGGSQDFNSKYAVVSKEFRNLRTNIGYAYGSDYASLDGIFGSVEYQPFPWIQLAGEYDTKEWNVALKSDHVTELGGQKIHLGVMAKNSFNYNDVSFGVYASIPFDDSFLRVKDKEKQISYSMSELESLGLNNVSSVVKEDTLWFSYENTVYTWNDIDALGMVLGILATNSETANIVVTIKKSNIPQYQVRMNSEAYRKFLKSGEYAENLLIFNSLQNYNEEQTENSDRFKPLITLQPSFILVDGSEYGHMDHTLAMQAGISMRLAKGTILSGRYNIPLSMSDNFKYGGVFDYRNRNKTDASIDQLLLSQYFQTNFSLPWVNLLQAGIFDNDLKGVSWESGLSDLSGKHFFLLKLAYLQDDLYTQMDRYSDSKNREEKLLSYSYYLDDLNANIKLTAGEFLYGDRGASLSFKRYFSDMYMQFDISRTQHDLRGTNNVAKMTLSMPFGLKKRFKTDYFDIQGGDLTYERRKTLVAKDDTGYAQPLHLKEIDNDFTLEKYYRDHGRFHPKYIETNHHRLRSVFFDN